MNKGSIYLHIYIYILHITLYFLTSVTSKLVIMSKCVNIYCNTRKQTSDRRPFFYVPENVLSNNKSWCVSSLWISDREPVSKILTTEIRWCSFMVLTIHLPEHVVLLDHIFIINEQELQLPVDKIFYLPSSHLVSSNFTELFQFMYQHLHLVSLIANHIWRTLCLKCCEKAFCFCIQYVTFT